MTEVKSIVLTEFGGLENMKVMNWPISANLGSTELEVQVSVCGMNFADVYTRRKFLPQLKTPLVLGLECVGQVMKVGLEVKQFKPGQRVLCYKWTGGLYRERVNIEEKYCFAVPDQLTDEQLVSLPSQYLTAYFCLFEFGNLRPNQSVLIHSCLGGVGNAATQLCRTVPNVTIHGTTSAHKHGVALAKGVDHVFRIDELTAQKHRYDIVIDPLGGAYSAVNQSLLNHLGRSIMIGASSTLEANESPVDPAVEARDLVLNNRSVSGLHMGLLCENAPLKVKACIEQLYKLCIAGQIQPLVHGVYTFDQIHEAQEELLQRRNVGKILIKPRENAAKPTAI